MSYNLLIYKDVPAIRFHSIKVFVTQILQPNSRFVRDVSPTLIRCKFDYSKYYFAHISAAFTHKCQHFTIIICEFQVAQKFTHTRTLRHTYNDFTQYFWISHSVLWHLWRSSQASQASATIFSTTAIILRLHTWFSQTIVFNARFNSNSLVLAPDSLLLANTLRTACMHNSHLWNPILCSNPINAVNDQQQKLQQQQTRE